MKPKLAKNSNSMDRAELTALTETSMELARAHAAAASTAQAACDAWATRPECRTIGDLETAATHEPALVGLLRADHRARVRIAELEQTMVDRGWWSASQRTVLLTDDGIVLMRLPQSVGLRP